MDDLILQIIKLKDFECPSKLPCFICKYEPFCRHIMGAIKEGERIIEDLKDEGQE